MASRTSSRGLLNAFPTTFETEVLANRATGSMDIIFAIFVRYQPGGLGERARLLQQLL